MTRIFDDGGYPSRRFLFFTPTYSENSSFSFKRRFIGTLSTFERSRSEGSVSAARGVASWRRSAARGSGARDSRCTRCAASSACSATVRRRTRCSPAAPIASDAPTESSDHHHPPLPHSDRAGAARRRRARRRVRRPGPRRVPQARRALRAEARWAIRAHGACASPEPSSRKPRAATRNHASVVRVVRVVRRRFRDARGTGGQGF